ncbi:hypothetical protein RvY_15261 [Ramazzottius varieornatus]|uniref:SH2 domain-containing protein n=1 Tax=Ramazzottius varieornatus TaxID=947166 RepID=A0A1D1W2C6_RAMVA|nr:hypothetical protein RvY_15261 [Ramazzottius varieornatus]
MTPSLHLPFRRTKSSVDHNSCVRTGQQLIASPKSPVSKSVSLQSSTSQTSLLHTSPDSCAKSGTAGGIIKYIQNKMRRSSLYSTNNSDTDSDHGFGQDRPYTVAISNENKEAKDGPQLTLRARRNGLWPLTLNSNDDLVSSSSSSNKTLPRQSANTWLSVPPELPPRVPERSPVSLGLVPPTPTSRSNPRTPQSCSSLSSYEIPLGLDEVGQVPIPSPSSTNRPMQCSVAKNYKPFLPSILSEDTPPEEDAPLPPLPSPLPSPLRDHIPSCHEDFSVTAELHKLAKCGWYWGPITRSDAEQKLLDKPDGTFLVRNSLDQNYILSLSFRSLGQSLHARIEYSNGRFSFCPRLDEETFPSVVDLVEKAMEKATVCYSRARDPDSPTFPVRLLYPVSRFSEVPSLKYLCRFAIRLDLRAEHWEDARLPNTVRKYISFEHPLVS